MMKQGYENKRLKLNCPMRGHRSGDVVDVAVDKDGVPVERYWRDRLKESPIDGNCEIVKAKTKKTGGKK